MEDSFGAELVAREYARLITADKGKPILSSNCPAVVTYIEKYHPQLVGNLAPIVSPMIAMGRLIKSKYNPKAKVVFIGPCVAKKAEGRDERVAGAVDGILTFAELKEMFAAKGINPDAEGEEAFSGPKPDLGRLFPMSKGLFRIARLPEDIVKNDTINAHGKEYVKQIIREFAEGEITARLINLHFCHGCIDGPIIDNELSGFRRKELVANYARSQANPAQTEKDIKEYAGTDLKRKFTARGVGLATPSEEEIQGVLKRIGKEEPNQINCGACGYSTCRELATSVCQGIAEVEMCWPYVLQTLKTTQEGLIQAEKLTSLGQLAASVAHEINNPLAGVLVYTQLLAKKINSDQFNKENATEYLAKMETELNRSSRLIRNLLDFARQSPPRFWEVDINEVINRSFELAAHSAQLQHVQVIKELDPALPKITADFDQLQQVCTNLIMNAIQAMPGGGTLDHTHLGG